MPRVVINTSHKSDVEHVKDIMNQIEQKIIGHEVNDFNLAYLNSFLLDLTQYVTLISITTHYKATEYNTHHEYLVYLYDEDAAKYITYCTGLNNDPDNYVKYNKKIEELLSNKVSYGFNWYDLGENNG